MGNVIEFECVSREPIAPDTVLSGALDAKLTEVVVIGQRPDGSVYFAMSTTEVPEINWLLDCAKRLLMDGILQEDET